MGGSVILYLWCFFQLLTGDTRVYGRVFEEGWCVGRCRCKCRCMFLMLYFVAFMRFLVSCSRSRAGAGVDSLIVSLLARQISVKFSVAVLLGAPYYFG